MAISLSVSSGCVRHQRGLGAFDADAEGFISFRSSLATVRLQSVALRGHFGETLCTADGGNIRPKAQVLPNVLLQLAAFVPAIQYTDLQRSVVPLFERVHVSNPHVDLRRRWRRGSRPSSAVLRTPDHLGAARANLLRSSSSSPSLDIDAAKFMAR